MAIEQADQFLAACVRSALAGHPSPPWPAELANTSGHVLVARRASFHGIAVLLGRAGAMLSDWPEAAATPVKREMRLAGLWEALHHSHLTSIMARLAAEGIATMVLKGTALAYLFYDDPATRRRGDTDLLIHPRDLAATRQVLQDSGCTRRQDPYGLIFQETWLIDCGADLTHSIDLHWEPSDRPVLQKILKASRFWDKPAPVPRLSPHAAAPSREMMLVHGAVNQAWHCARGYGVDDARVTGGRRLIWAVDYLKLTQHFDHAAWQRLAEFCETADAAGIVHAALEGAQRDIGLAVPADVMERIAAAASASPGLAYITDPGVVREFWRDMQAADNLAVRARLLKGMLLAPRSHLVEKYPDHAHWPTFLLQLRRYSGILLLRPRTKR